jgi:Na+-translocating ferredoxin:NAD+ oxidoreductase RnfD subunit
MNAVLIPPRLTGTSTGSRVWRFLRTPKNLLTVVFLPLLALGGATLGWTTVAAHVGSAVAGACLAELLALRVRHVAWRWPSSALLSGLIVAFVLGPETPWAVTLIVGALATFSKHLLRTRRGHIFNPAALALLLSIPLFATAQSWWGALPDLAWPWLLVLLLGGALVVERVDKFPLVLAFMGAYFSLFTLVAFIDPARVAEMFRAPFLQAALFFACFMLTDPPTSPGRDAEQVPIGILVAMTSCAAQLLGAGQAYLLIGILLGNVALAGRRWIGDGRSGTRVGSPPGRQQTSNEAGGRLARFLAAILVERAPTAK